MSISWQKLYGVRGLPGGDPIEVVNSSKSLFALLTISFQIFTCSNLVWHSCPKTPPATLEGPLHHYIIKQQIDLFQEQQATLQLNQ